MFRHEATLYAGIEGFVDAAVPFIAAALSAGEPVMVAVSREKIARLTAALAADAKRVRFADMDELGANPARIIPAWIRFVNERPRERASMWGIGEPIGPAHGGAELIESQLHESLLNAAFADTPGFNLLCPYDVEALARAVIVEAHRSHPSISRGGVPCASGSYCEPDLAGILSDPPLAPAPTHARELRFDRLDSLPAIRHVVQQVGLGAGFGHRRAADFALAINELVANSFVHGGGHGVLRIWEEGDGLVCEVVDAGRFNDPLVGRRPPEPGQMGGWGLWLANQLCELVQVRSRSTGSVVRAHVRRPT